MRKYNSFIVTSYMFYGILTLISFITGIEYIKIIIYPIIFISLFKIKIFYKNILYFLPFILLVFINFLITDANYEAIRYHLLFFLFNVLGAIYVGSLVIDLVYFQKYIFKYSLLNLVLLYIFVFLKKNISLGVDYMSLGYAMLQVLIFLLYLKYEDYSQRLLINIGLVLALIFIFFLGNRFSSFIAVFGIISLYFFNLSTKYQKIKFILILGGILLFLKFYLFYLIERLSEVLKSYNINLIGLNRIMVTLYRIQENTDFTSGRIDIYKQAIQVIFDNPFGIGLFGYLKKIDGATIGYYPHNIFIEIALNWGIIIFLIFILFSLYFFYRFLKIKDKRYRNFIWIFCLLNMNLLVSNSYMKYQFFWLFLAISLNKSYRRNSS